ncbi:MAG: hypothetical protein HOY75_13245 [Streptomyces sp.]|nr:hypothetical protein [Streptomyces sp.]
MRTQTLPAAAHHAIARIESALAAPDREQIARVGQALGLRIGWKPNAHLGDTATRITMWTQHELNDVFERVGGTVTTRTVQRASSDGESTWDATEITLTTEVPGVGYVEVVTDWDEESGGRDLAVMQSVADVDLIA